MDEPLIHHGESLAYVRDQMGHGSIHITMDIYGHPAVHVADARRAQDAVRRLAHGHVIGLAVLLGVWHLRGWRMAAQSSVEPI